MQTITRNTLKITMALLVLVAMLAAGLKSSVAYAAPCTPTVSFDLYAKTGIATLYGTTTVNIYGYSSTAGGDATLPGPVLDVSQGVCVGITLYNDLSETTSLLFQGQDMIPDTVGVAPGGSFTYTFTASSAGTFLYEAGLLANAQHQVAMGLYGALIVRPAALGQAYDDPSTAFTKETVLVLSEFDPSLYAVTTKNPLGDSAAFDMREYNPRYFLINGKAYPGTLPFAVDPADTVLFRYVNAGLQAHAMSTLGLSQTIIAQDGSPYALSHKVVAETIATGQTLDTLVVIPATAVTGDMFALYDANMSLRNNTGTGATNSGVGGMLTFLTVGSTPPPGPDITGPLLSSLSLSPNPSIGSVNVNLSFTANDTTTGNSNVVAAEYWIDSGAATAIPVGSPAPVVPLSTSIGSSFSAGTHVVSVRAQDAAGNWSSTGTINLIVDNSGPVTSGLSLTPNPSNGSVNVTLSFTANDSANGNSNVTAAEYWIDSGAPAAVTVSSPAPVKTLSAVIPPSGLTAGLYTVSVRSQDALGNWGIPATITLVVDQTGPTTSGVSASPNPNNGSWGFNTSVQAVRVTASFSDAATGGSNIAAAEGFLDTVGTTGTGYVFAASDGTFNSPSETGLYDIPLAVIAPLSEGSHTIYVHAKDASGNWGGMSTTVLVIKKSLYFSTLGTTNPPGVGGTADDADIYLWNGAVFSRVIDASIAPYSLPSGANVDGFDRVDATHFYMSFSGNVSVPGPGTVQDEDIVYYNAGTWSVFFDGTARGLNSNNLDIDAFTVVGSTIYFSTVGNSNPPGVSGTADAADIYLWNGTAFSRVVDASTIGVPVTSGNNNTGVDGLVWIDATHFYLSFSADNTTIVGLGAVQDEDVVYYNNGTWLLYFDGTARGLTNSNQDIDAFDIP